MYVTLEDFVPYEQSKLWRFHDAYFARRGAAAWTENEIPCYATSNFAFARLHATLFLSAVAELEAAGALRPDERIEVLELGSGLGLFAANFLDALASLGEAGARAHARIRYYFTDYVEISLREAVASSLLAEHVAKGRLVPALLDLRRPRELRALDGAPIRPTLSAIISNYVVCVVPVKLVQKAGAEVREKFVKISLEVPDDAPEEERVPEMLLENMLAMSTTPKLIEQIQSAVEWRPTDLARFVGDPFHAGVVAEVLAPRDEATVCYPIGWLEALRELRAWLRPGGLVLVNDYGDTDAADLAGLRDADPQHFGNTLAHGVNTSIFEVFGRRAGMAVARTRNPLHSVHTTALRNAPAASPAFLATFRKLYVRSHASDDLLDLQAAGHMAVAKEDNRRAARLFERALRLDPDNMDILFQVGQVLVGLGFGRRALKHLRRGRRLDATSSRNFDFQIGMAHFVNGDYRRSVSSYKRAIALQPTPAAWTNLAVVYATMEKHRRAWRALSEALALDPEFRLAVEFKRSLAETWAEKTLGASRAPGGPAPRPPSTSAAQVTRA